MEAGLQRLLVTKLRLGTCLSHNSAAIQRLMARGQASMQTLDNKHILITGGTGSLGQVLVRRLLSGSEGKPERVIVFSRDEAKQHYMRMQYEHAVAATDEIIYRNFQRMLQFRIGDVRDFH